MTRAAFNPHVIFQWLRSVVTQECQSLGFSLLRYTAFVVPARAAVFQVVQFGTFTPIEVDVFFHRRTISCSAFLSFLKVVIMH